MALTSEFKRFKSSMQAKCNKCVIVKLSVKQSVNKERFNPRFILFSLSGAQIKSLSI